MKQDRVQCAHWYILMDEYGKSKHRHNIINLESFLLVQVILHIITYLIENSHCIILLYLIVSLKELSISYK